MKKMLLVLMFFTIPIIAKADCTVDVMNDDVGLQIEKQLSAEAVVQLLVRCDEPTNGELWVTAPDGRSLMGAGAGSDLQTTVSINGHPVDQPLAIQADQAGTPIPIQFKVTSALYPPAGEYREDISLRLEY
ncbi:TPA: hypothetical protein ACXNC8_001580 [Stenotrophomonas maltophilia]